MTERAACRSRAFGAFCLGFFTGLQVAPATAEAQPLVLFFGGRGANAVDMRRWTAAARQDARYGTRFAFEAVAYPFSGKDSPGSAVAAAGLVEQRLALGLASTPRRKVVLVGHSSGANIAAAVLAKLREAGNVRMILLDGSLDVALIAPRGFRRELQLECWSATSGHLASVNRDAVEALCDNDRYTELHAPNCRTAVCLHFWLVNKRAPLALDYRLAGQTTPDGSTVGYQNLQINLEWLRNLE